VEGAMNAAHSLERILESATAASGLEDFGPGEFRANAELLLQGAIESGASSSGLDMLAARIRRLLENRLRIVADRKAYPQISAQKLAAPIVVLGLPRSGTTFLHSLLSRDHRLRCPLQWEISRPSPPPRRETFQTDPRIALSRAEMAGDAETLRLHMQDAELPVECGPVFAGEFMNTGNFAFWDAPDYLARVMGRDGRGPIQAAYAHHKWILQHLQAFAPRERWALKSPQHIANLAELLAAYPDAVLVFTHRDPVDTIPSLASLVSHFRRRTYDAPDLARIGRDVCRLWLDGINRCMDFRASEPAVSARCIDIAYQDLIDRPIAVLERIYQSASMDLEPARAAVVAWIDTHRQDRWREQHGRHEYSPEMFGLTSREIAAAFSAYRAAFDGAARRTP